MASFAPITEEFDRQFARQIPPAAQHLWKWLRRQAPPGREIEFDLKEFAATFSYTLKWAREALKQLIAHNLVEEIRRFYGYWWKIRVIQVGDIGNKTSVSREENSTDRAKTSQSPPANARSSANTNKGVLEENKQAAESHHHHPVQNGQQEAATPRTNRQAPTHEEVLQEIEQTGIVLNQQLIGLVHAAAPAVARNALDALREQKELGNALKNPEGYLRRAIQSGWTPNYERPTRRSRAATAPDPVQQASVNRTYQHLGIETKALDSSPVRRLINEDDDLSPLLATIQGLHRQLGLTKAFIEARFQERYGKAKQYLLSSAELADWLEWLQDNEGVLMLSQQT